MCTINDNHMVNGRRDKECDRQNFLSFWLDCFLPFYSPNNSENQNFEKMKKKPDDIIILHVCIIDENYMMYGSCDKDHNRQNFVILERFLHF